MIERTSDGRARVMGTNAIQKVAGWARAGALPNCYKSFEDSLYDFYPDLPWDKSATVAIQYILDQHGTELDLILQVFRFDMKESLQKALVELAD